MAHLLTSGVEHPTFEDCDRALMREVEVRGEFARGAWRSHRQACGAVLAYFARFRPPLACTLLGVEVPVGPMRVDLLWQTGDGRPWADEIKLGSYSSLTDRDAVVVQLGAQARALFDHDPTALGVRLLPLRCPPRAVWLDRTYSLRPLTTEDLR